ncbi:MAG: hypothetical protein A2383_00830 [Candidatus Pacebacteria bacterium RIFOXYB1_FULL_39_46]|nr:MAG: hypothetical protein A2182_00665 [Candidatus Pacebacteria bacterium RIFOXYA1_FULL_38_18]OGJ38127.1 MAG: hypothetical protein A2383_00830 [Candidatus Pacebacteria bacterium RIFOXYB1_FULL_39_46]OGJ39651.1 MAG: hypothetical protein A2411_02610 [Candidatus Pacebacteria bacterium RIFOXYC1_FULL_39_21]OGJ39879.1 MAG: hypothetical protein A2582_00595 [Candidatus Pacebacteria bacterium RIFOXYD1_FULL_39_27]
MENLDETALNIFTDGSMYSHPRKGGIGIKFVWVGDDGNEESYDHEEIGYKGVTIQQMELLACIIALREVIKENPMIKKNTAKIVIYTDSIYVSSNQNNAIYNWPQNKWLTKNGTPVLNIDLWKELVKLQKKIGKRVDFKWQKGKSSAHTKAVDKLAKKSATSAIRPSISVKNVRRKKSKKSVSNNNLVMKGQRAIIRITSDEYLKKHKLYKYDIEVKSKKSDYFRSEQPIFSERLMSAGHEYMVRFNKNNKNPRIIELYGEMK